MLGILLSNLVTPDAPTPKALRKYLKEFLWDPRVFDGIPRWVWWFILNGVVLRTRPEKSAKLYKKIWTENGSPLLLTTYDQARKLEQHYHQANKKNISIRVGMRYGHPGIPFALDQLKKDGCEKILLLPLYPQYCSATTATTWDAFTSALSRSKNVLESRMVMRYYDHPQYIQAVVDSIQEEWSRSGKTEKLLFSFHGVPMRFSREGDSYESECRVTAENVAEALSLSHDEWLISFQSRFGREEWLQPYTSDVIREFGRDELESLSVVCPGFSVDCLETLEEMEEENKDIFLQAGGKQFTYISCLNARDDHIRLMATLVDAHTQDWTKTMNNEK